MEDYDCQLNNVLSDIIENDKSNSVGNILGKKDEIEDTTIVTYLSPSVKQIFHNGRPTPDGVGKINEGIVLFHHL